MTPSRTLNKLVEDNKDGFTIRTARSTSGRLTRQVEELKQGPTYLDGRPDHE